MSGCKKLKRTGLEVHEHCFVSGPRAHAAGNYKFSHSHEGGDVPHKHPGTGPASYTIDRDDWARTTGLRGGGRKEFTTAPSGEQFAWCDLEDFQRSFEVVVLPSARRVAEETRSPGAGVAPAARMVLAGRMKARAKGVR